MSHRRVISPYQPTEKMRNYVRRRDFSYHNVNTSTILTAPPPSPCHHR